MSRSARTILGVRIDNVTLPEAMRRAESMLNSRRFHQVVTPGPEFLLEATAHQRFRSILHQADLSLPDGMGLRVAGWLTGRPIKARVTGVDFVHGLLEVCARRGARVFFFGAPPQIVEKAVRRALRQYPGLIVVGYESGQRGPWQKVHEQRIIEKIHLAKPDVLLVALGAPKQELWIDRHRAALHDVRLAIGVGRTFDYLAGSVKRPPKLVRQLGLEWLLTYLMAGRLYQPQFRRQRVRNATWHFLRAVIRFPHDE